MQSRTTILTPTPTPPEHFDYTRAAQDAGLSPDQLKALIRLFEHDYPRDLMLRELHILRACNAILRGVITIEQALAPYDERAA